MAPKCCMSMKYSAWCIKYPATYKDDEGHTHCIFHMPKAKWDGTLEEFNSTVFSEIERAREAGKVSDLSGTVFAGDISFAAYDASNSLPEITFEEALFRGDADFSNAVFGSEARFKAAVFSAKADFSGATFSDEVHFEKTIFEKYVTFEKAVFKSRGRFFDSVFEEEALFSGSVFHGILYMSWGSFKKGADLNGVTFHVSPMLKRPVTDSKGDK